MDRGLEAPLSPHEEVTLRRVALGVAHPADLAAKDVDRLKGLLLIEEVNGGLRLTPMASSAISLSQIVPVSTPARPTKGWRS